MAGHLREFVERAHGRYRLRLAAAQQRHLLPDPVLQKEVRVLRSEPQLTDFQMFKDRFVPCTNHILVPWLDYNSDRHPDQGVRVVPAPAEVDRRPPVDAVTDVRDTTFGCLCNQSVLPKCVFPTLPCREDQPTSASLPVLHHEFTDLHRRHFELIQFAYRSFRRADGSGQRYDQ